MAASSKVSEIDPSAVFQHTKWQNFGFSGTKLNGIRFFDCQIRNCLFEQCQLEDWRLWSTTITECSFRWADLKRSALGGVLEGRRNFYTGVDFSEADLRQTVYQAAAFERCAYRNTKLVKIDFQTSAFSNCQFEGELNDVLFYHRGFKGEAFPPNEMLNVDFSHAKLRDVGFRGLILNRVRLPNDAEHLVLKDFASTLDKMVNVLKQREDITAKKVIAFLAIERKWAHPNQVQGVLNIQDLAEIAGEEGVKRLLEVVP